jgi:hypothetical protein
MEVCVEKLSEGSVSMVMKFSENYVCALWQEPGYCTSNQWCATTKKTLETKLSPWSIP